MMKKNMRNNKWCYALAFLAGFAALSAGVMGLWNVIIPDVTGWASVNYWQAAGLMLLSRLLLSGFGNFSGGMHKFHRRGRPHDFHSMKHLSHEERKERIRQYLFEDTAKEQPQPADE